MISCIVLSAGLSSRFGSPKALALINGQTIIERAQQMLVRSNINNIIIILGAEFERIKPYILKHKKVKVVYNKDYNFGQTSSFQSGLQSLDKDSKGIMLLPIDFPSVKTETINSLIKEFYLKVPKILIPQYQFRKGHPPIFDASLKKNFLNLQDDKGLNTVQRQHKKDIFLVETIDPGVIETFNTGQELDKIKTFLI